MGHHPLVFGMQVSNLSWSFCSPCLATVEAPSLVWDAEMAFQQLSIILCRKSSRRVAGVDKARSQWNFTVWGCCLCCVHGGKCTVTALFAVQSIMHLWRAEESVSWISAQLYRANIFHLEILRLKIIIIIIVRIILVILCCLIASLNSLFNSLLLTPPVKCFFRHEISL